MASVITPNMGLIEPSIGNTFSPVWAQNINDNFSNLDSHNHSPGSGVSITPSGLNINTDLPFGSNNAIALRTSRYAQQSAALTDPADLMCAYAVGTAGNLYWNDNAGNRIQITASGGVAGSPGSISNLTSPASATWVSGTATFVWAASSGVGANMDAATYVLRYPGSYPSPSGNYIALQAPSSLATGFALTFPAVLPAATGIVQIDTLGTISANLVVDNVTLQNATNQLSIKTNVNLPGDAVQENGRNLVVSNANAATSLSILRGTLNASRAINAGEGFTVTTGATGISTINFNTAFASEPTAVATAIQGSNFIVAKIISISTTAVTFATFVSDTTVLTNCGYDFIVIGPRT